MIYILLGYALISATWAATVTHTAGSTLNGCEKASLFLVLWLIALLTGCLVFIVYSFGFSSL